MNKTKRNKYITITTPVNCPLYISVGISRGLLNQGICIQGALYKVVSKISSYWELNTTSRRGIKQLGIPFGSIFLLFLRKVAGTTFIVARGIPRPQVLNDSKLRGPYTQGGLHPGGRLTIGCILLFTGRWAFYWGTL